MIKHILNKVVFFLLVLCFMGMLGSEAWACACISDKPSASIKAADAVFIGEVKESLSPGLKWVVAVSRVIKGNVKKEITLHAAMVEHHVRFLISRLEKHTSFLQPS